MEKICTSPMYPLRRATLLFAGAALLAGAAPCLAAATAPLPRTGQTACYDPAGNQLQSCAGTGQDGETLAGVAWPVARFKVNADATISDTLSGLAWSQDANAPGPLACGPGVTKTWPQALAYVKCLNLNSYQGHSDWRLPNVKELWSLFDAGQGTIATYLSNNHFENVQIGRYKSSTASPGNLTGTPLVMNLGDGSLQGYSYNVADYVWPVRNAVTAGLAAVPQTGATQCYDVSSGTAGSCAGTGQDGELQKGVPWNSATRFNSGAQTVDDNLTGLQWVKEGRTLSFGRCTSGALKWGDALLFVRCLNDDAYLGKSDWRLPNIGELSSLSHAGTDIYTWLSTAPVSLDLDPNHSYWSSSTYLQQTDSAWTVLLGLNGSQSRLGKTQFGNVLPVRNLSGDASIKVGDVNRSGVTDIADALLIYQMYLDPPATVDPTADVAPLDGNGRPLGNGSIDLGDVITILRYLVFKGTPGAVQW
jgi:hypothetical protein